MAQEISPARRQKCPGPLGVALLFLRVAQRPDFYESQWARHERWLTPGSKRQLALGWPNLTLLGVTPPGQGLRRLTDRFGGWHRWESQVVIHKPI